MLETARMKLDPKRPLWVDRPCRYSVSVPQPLGMVVGPQASFRLIWVSVITTMFSCVLAMVDSTEVYKTRWCAGITLPTNLQADQFPFYTSSRFERHVVSADCQLLHSIRGGSAVLLLYPGRFPWWKGEIGRTFTERSTNVGYSAKTLMLPTDATAGDRAMASGAPIAIRMRLPPALRMIAGKPSIVDRPDLLLPHGMI